MALLTVSGISKKGNDSFVVKEISFSQQPLQKIAIAGETGSGKTTLLKMIAGLIQPDEGEIIFDNNKVIGPADKLLPGHPGIAYLSQHFELRNNYRVHELLSYTNELPADEAAALYRVCQIGHLVDRRTDQLSGGEKQRIALARLLITSPKLLILDEPFSNLDAIHKRTIKSVIQDISEKLRITCMMVSHDPEDILSWADDIKVMKDGKIIQHGTPESVYKKPVNEYCAGLFGNYTILGSELRENLFTIPEQNLDRKQALVRPEHIHISINGPSSLSGTIQQINFFGSYYILLISVSHQQLLVKTVQQGFSVGDTVFLTIAAKDIAYV
ncbi:MAG: ABC transporter ATP-binding protein [Chitinophagales bacterium]|nr:ABC transporter ATP-binding protein [Chitinophagales bacterium]